MSFGTKGINWVSRCSWQVANNDADRFATVWILSCKPTNHLFPVNAKRMDLCTLSEKRLLDRSVEFVSTVCSDEHILHSFNNYCSLYFVRCFSRFCVQKFNKLSSMFCGKYIFTVDLQEQQYSWGQISSTLLRPTVSWSCSKRWIRLISYFFCLPCLFVN